MVGRGLVTGCGTDGTRGGRRKSLPRVRVTSAFFILVHGGCWCGCVCDCGTAGKLRVRWVWVTDVAISSCSHVRPSVSQGDYGSWQVEARHPALLCSHRLGFRPKAAFAHVRGCCLLCSICQGWAGQQWVLVPYSEAGTRDCWQQQYRMPSMRTRHDAWAGLGGRLSGPFERQAYVRFQHRTVIRW